MKLSVLYRGPLSSCNYGCEYCPFAKRQESPADHRKDSSALTRFLDWCETCGEEAVQLSVFFTPWGEALHHRRYQEAFVRLTNLPHIEKVTIQTNLSCRLEWVEQCDKSKMALWSTYHPGEVPRERFISRCMELRQRQIAFSVGIVGMQEHMAEIEFMRVALPDEVYVWLNAYKRVPDYYSADDLTFLQAIDPLFPMNSVRHPSKGRACRTGEHVISVDGDGTIRRCHFIKTPIGNIYDDEWKQALRPRLCTNDTCGCHIGYVHMPHLGLGEVFGAQILERIPQHLSTD